MKRPTRGAAWHVLDSAGHVVADLHGRSLQEAKRAAAGLAAGLKRRTLLISHADLVAQRPAARPPVRRRRGPSRARSSRTALHVRAHGASWLPKSKRRSPTRRRARARHNPAPTATLAQGAQMYEKWHRFGYSKLQRVQLPDRPRVLVKLGHVVRIDYLSHKWDGRRRRYAHSTQRPYPVLATSPDGKDFFLLAGRMKATERGLIH